MNKTTAATLGPLQPPTSDVKRVSLYQARRKIHPRSVSGTFASWRWVMVWLTQIVFYGLPWLAWNGRQAVLFDLASRRFYLFGLVLYPQDFIYLTALLVTCAYSLFLFTALSGRLWCGYACPQTVYTEIFLWVEQRFEGDRNARIQLDRAAWSLDKAWRRGGKHLAWIAIAAWTGFTFVGYFSPIRTLAADALALQLAGWPLFWMPFYAFLTWGAAGFMREQVCKYMCPYARFQSAMLDRDTLIVTYDAARGEPRTPLRLTAAKAGSPAAGACVDCKLCEQVCPTGIDIRNGLQYECIGCGACIDACDDVMRRAGRPTGLVRYDTQNGMALGLSSDQRLRHLLRPRTLVYGSILVLIVAGVATGLALRPPFKADVVRDRATLARVVDDGQIENVYRVQIMNATESPQRYRVGAAGLPGLAPTQEVTASLGPAEAQWVVVALRLPPESAAGREPGSHPIHLDVERLAAAGQPAYTLSEKTTFMLPR